MQNICYGKNMVDGVYDGIWLSHPHWGFRIRYNEYISPHYLRLSEKTYFDHGTYGSFHPKKRGNNWVQGAKRVPIHVGPALLECTWAKLHQFAMSHHKDQVHDTSNPTGSSSFRLRKLR